MVTKRGLVFSAVYFIVTFSSFLFLLVTGTSLTQEIDSSFLSGFITASGVFKGFLTASAISKSDALDLEHYLLTLLNLALFFGVLNVIFVGHLVHGMKTNSWKPNLLDFSLVMISVNANALTGLMIAERPSYVKVRKLLFK